jgi:hypothetical protein
VIAKTIEIPYKYGQTIKIACVSDIHFDSRFCDRRKFRADVRRWGKMKNTFLLGVGDYTEMIANTDPRYRPSGQGAPERDDQIDWSLDQIAEALEPMRGRILGLGRGNHEDNFLKRHGVNLVRRLADRLDTEDLGFSWMLRLKLGEPTAPPRKWQRSRSVYIYGHHGWGGGSRTAGGNVTKFERLRGSYDADIFLVGHVHQKHTDRYVRIGMAGDSLLAKPQIVAICGTYLRTLSDGPDPSYAEAKGFPPAEIGSIMIHIKPKGGHPSENRVGDGWVDLWAEG